MSAQVSADPSDLSRVVSFGDAVITRETDFGGPVASRLPKFDLTSAGGRASAAAYYKDMFQRFGTSDAYIAGYNVRFDVGKIMDSARQIPEFMEDPDAVKALAAFEERMLSGGGMIDTLQMVRAQLKSQVAQRLEAASARGDDYGVRAALAIESILSPPAMSRATDVGEKVSAFGLENIVQSTDFLHTLAKRAQAGDAVSEGVLRQLAASSVSHTDVVDRTVTQLLTEIALSPDGVKLIPEDGRSHLVGITDDNRRLVARARLNVSGAKAMVSTTTLADPRYLTEKTLSYLYETPEAFRKIEIQDQLSAVIGSSSPIPAGLRENSIGTLKYGADSSGTPGFVFQPIAAGTAPVPISETIATSYIKRELDAIRAMPADPAPIIAGTMPPRTSVVKSLGINPIQQTNIEYMGRFLATGSASTINTGTILEAARSIAANEGSFITGMTATGNVTGFTSGLSPGDSIGAFGVVRNSLTALSQSRMEAYQKALYESGIVASSMQPEVRSAAVSLSAITAPLGASNTQLISGALAHEVDATGAVVRRTAEDVASRMGASSDVIAKNLPLLSETGIVFTQPQKAISIGDTVLAIPAEIAKEMKTLDDLGNEISFVERLKGETGSKSSRVRLSVPTRTEITTPTVNVIYGGTLGLEPTARDLERATKEAQEFIKIARSKIQGKTPGEMIEAGFATTEEHAQRILASINDPRSVENIARTIVERGAIVGTIDPSVSPQSRSMAVRAAEILDNIGSGINNDIVARQKGLEFNIALFGEEGVVLTPRVSDEMLSEANRAGNVLGRQVTERSSSTRQVSLLQGAIRRGVDTAGEDDGGFFGRLRSFARSVRPDAEISGSSRAISRRFRDMDIAERMKFLKPKVYTGVAAVAALSAGYYLARRGQKNQAYNETMEQQEFEPGPMSIQDFNNIDQELARQTSSRRDPLVTAGIVGNLDRNKTSHYKMGPNKYNHLYGG